MKTPLVEKIREIQEMERRWYQEWAGKPRNEISVHRHHTEIKEALEELYALAGAPPRQGATAAGPSVPEQLAREVTL